MSRFFLWSLLFLLPLGGLVGCTSESGSGETVRLLNVSYDPTRELWKDLNQQFVAQYAKEKGITVEIEQAHGGSSAQARSVVQGNQADVVTLAMWQDTDLLRKKKLIAEGWEDRLPHRSLPYYSTIVFVVRQGNPKNVHDWADLDRDDVKIISPSPKTSGNGKLSFLAAWGSVLERGGSEADAKQFVTNLYKRVPVLDEGARGATASFAQKGLGDVHLTWENEAHLEVSQSGGKLEIVYPKKSIRAEPHVAWVDAVVEKKQTRQVAEDYLQFLYTDAGQRTIGKHHYRPIEEKILAEFSRELPPIELFPITRVAADWNDIQAKFFDQRAIFDQIFTMKQ